PAGARRRPAPRWTINQLACRHPQQGRPRSQPPAGRHHHNREPTTQTQAEKEMSLDTADWSLLISALGLSMVVGAGLFQALFVMPESFSTPPASLRRYQQDRSYPFWLPLHVVILIAIVIAAAAGWHQDRRTLILAAAGCYTLCWVITLLFFIPGVIAFGKVDV